ncbi:MAG: ABC transporter ATP-binding protein, partial [Opitutaceae bacterium]|nr:ABC transporter ATP-binding protein [Opitutaceae bacterium]
MDWVWNFNEWLSMYMISSIFIVVVLMINNIYVGLVLLAVCIVMILINMRKVKKTKPYNNKANNYFEKYNAQLTESLSHVATIKTLSAQNKINSLFNQATEGIRKYRLIQFKIQRRHNTVRDTLGTIGLLAGVVI